MIYARYYVYRNKSYKTFTKYYSIKRSIKQSWFDEKSSCTRCPLGSKKVLNLSNDRYLTSLHKNNFALRGHRGWTITQHYVLHGTIGISCPEMNIGFSLRRRNGHASHALAYNTFICCSYSITCSLSSFCTQTYTEASQGQISICSHK